VVIFYKNAFSESLGLSLIVIVITRLFLPKSGEMMSSLSRTPGSIECQRKIFTDIPEFNLFLLQKLDVTTQFSFTLIL